MTNILFLHIKINFNRLILYIPDKIPDKSVAADWMQKMYIPDKIPDKSVAADWMQKTHIRE